MLKAIPFATDVPETAHIKSLRRIGFVYGAIVAAVFMTAGLVVSSQVLPDRTADYAAVSPSRAVH
jgi:hypothetical protein